MRPFRLLAVFALTAGLAVALGDVSSADDSPATKAEKLAKLKEKLKNADPATKAKLLEKFKNADPETKAKFKGLFKGQGKGKGKAEPPQAPPPALAPAKPTAPPPKPPAEQNPAALARLIDGHLDRKLSEAKVSPAPQATDDEFLRRAYLDLSGVIPTLAQAKAFLDDKAPDKRSRLIDELLAGPNFGRHLTDGWMAKLVPGGTDNRFIPRDPFGDWLEKQFNDNRPWNEVVADILTATGTVEENPAVTFVLANRSTDKLTDQTTQHFLGVQLQCAQCHNHPFTEWKQAEYWGVAAFFEKVKPDNPRNVLRGFDNLKIGVAEGVGRSKVKDFFPEGAKTVPAKFLGGPEPELNRAAPYRPVLATWLTAADNPYFAKAMANRVWGQLFGRGIVNPVDDLHDGNPPSHPELLDTLAKDFAANGFDLKYLYRAVCNTNAYGRTSKPPKGAADPDPALFARMTVKVMTPEQLFDSLAQATGAQAQIAERMKDNPKRGPVGPRNQFVQFFLAGAEEANPVEYEAGIPQALKLMNSRLVGNPAAVRAYASPSDPPAAVFERVYLAALSRRPTPAEVKKLNGYMTKAGNPAAGYSDVLWAVLNSSEFTMVR
ncbi:MAG: DUF1549 and DUF1553 domain-containing protein [Gemmataceae bacterium]|nr:DUF1549 and DUF1553 domain-containing protein [Gemmataceae bacterium]